jgi:hypothetical protein
MTAVTVIVDALLAKLRLISEFSNPGSVCDDIPQIDEYTPLPVCHLRELKETAIERRGTGWKRLRSLQLDLYQEKTGGRSARDALLDAVLIELVPLGFGVPLEGKSLLKLSIGTIALEPEEIQSELYLTSIPITIEYTS